MEYYLYELKNNLELNNKIILTEEIINLIYLYFKNYYNNKPISLNFSNLKIENLKKYFYQKIQKK